VPLKGSFSTLLIGTLIYVIVTTTYGTMISAFARTQIAALFVTAILTVLPATMLVGMLVPVSAFSRIARVMGGLLPRQYARRKMETWPLNGSAPIICCTLAARPSNPARRSIGRQARNTFVPGGRAIILDPAVPIAPAAAPSR
jgi:CBS domain containing-hemolysin-like protein